jgi:hypothetical protein
MLGRDMKAKKGAAFGDKMVLRFRSDGARVAP